jgi:hypothetical protein
LLWGWKSLQQLLGFKMDTTWKMHLVLLAIYVCMDSSQSRWRPAPLKDVENVSR